MNCLFLYNPCSGKGKINKYIKYISKKLAEKYDFVQVKASSRAGELSELAKAACGQFDALFFAGGDGSFNEVLNGIAEMQIKPVLGYIPMGTVNDIGHSLSIPCKKVKKALKKLLNGKEVFLDVMKINDKYAQYEIGAGALMSCSYKAPRSQKVKLGKIAYGIEILRNNMKFEDFCITVQSGEKQIETNCEFLLFINSRSVAGMPINPKAVLDDGEIELIIVKQVGKPKWRHKVLAFFHIINFFVLGYKNSNQASYEKIKGANFKVQLPDNVVWNLDGEEGCKGSAEINVLKRHIRVLVPNKNKRRD